mmetsp:Transcript_15060/g.28492  ORF Transcript_15060/g.28492 Transcript_15060/m.28492 type:complete len:251 (+) Transcript_15060:515-1267(+)
MGALPLVGWLLSHAIQQHLRVHGHRTPTTVACLVHVRYLPGYLEHSVPDGFGIDDLAEEPAPALQTGILDGRRHVGDLGSTSAGVDYVAMRFELLAEPSRAGGGSRNTCELGSLRRGHQVRVEAELSRTGGVPGHGDQTVGFRQTPCPGASGSRCNRFGLQSHVRQGCSRFEEHGLPRTHHGCRAVLLPGSHPELQACSPKRRAFRWGLPSAPRAVSRLRAVHKGKPQGSARCPSVDFRLDTCSAGSGRG